MAVGKKGSYNMKIEKYTKKNGTTVYRSKIYLGIDAISGKKIRKSLTAPTTNALKNKIKQAHHDFIANGSTVESLKPIKIYNELVELWLESYKLTVKPQTYTNTMTFLHAYIIPYFDGLQLEKITVSMVQKFINELAPKVARYKVVHSYNKRIFKYAVSLQLLKSNPCDNVMVPNIKHAKKNKTTFIDGEDLKNFMAYMQDLATKDYTALIDYTLYSLLLASGLRIGEAIALQWSDIDTKNKTITVSKTYNSTHNVVTTPKSKNAYRVISIDNITIALLSRYKMAQSRIFADISMKSPINVFATPARDFLYYNTIRHRLKKHLKAINLPMFEFHAFRHTHASLLLNAGISYKELQNRLGHAKLSMTMDTYAHLSKDKEREAVTYYEKALQNIGL